MSEMRDGSRREEVNVIPLRAALGRRGGKVSRHAVCVLSLLPALVLAYVGISALGRTRPALVVTQPLAPQRYHFTVERLPAPGATQSVRRSPKRLDIPDQAVLRAPPGFEVSVFADDVPDARWLALTPAGDVLVTSTRKDDILLLRDADRDGLAEDCQTFGGSRNGLNLPFGIAFHEGQVFIANTDGVLRFPYQPGQDKLAGRGEKIHDLPGDGYHQHWTRNVIVSADRQHLLVTVGSESNVDVEPAPRASILAMRLDGSESRVLASGLRNPVGLALHPQTRELYATVNERDRLGDDLVPDYLTRVEEGAFYGWPYAYLSPGHLDPRRTKEGRSEAPELARRTKTPDVLFESHSAALGLTFYRGNAFPEHYRRGAFVAFRGSWNRSRGTGYKIVYVPFNAQHRPEGYYEDFVTGFLVDPEKPTVWGRPVGLLELPDGSLLFTDDTNDRVYRVRYTSL